MYIDALICSRNSLSLGPSLRLPSAISLLYSMVWGLSSGREQFDYSGQISRPIVQVVCTPLLSNSFSGAQGPSASVGISYSGRLALVCIVCPTSREAIPIFKALGFSVSCSEGGWCSRTLLGINALSFALPLSSTFMPSPIPCPPPGAVRGSWACNSSRKALERKKLSPIKVSGLSCVCML